MPRGRKKKPESLEAQIELVQGEIASLSESLKAKKKDLAELQSALKAQENQKLLDAIQASGKSVDEIISLLK